METNDPYVTYQITAPHMCAGLIAREGRFVDAAPIVKWAVGKPIHVVADWAKKRHFKFERVSND